MTSQEVKVAGIYMSCEIYNKEANIKKAQEFIAEAAEKGANIILLQELFNTGYVIYTYRSQEPFNLAEPIPGPTTKKIAESAKKYGIYIIAPIFERAGPGLYFNAAPVIGPDGEILGVYRKTHIPMTVSLEKFYFKPGNSFPVFKTEFGTLGVITCYDRHFPEIWRTMALKGAEIIFVPAAASLPNWGLELRIMSYQNGVYTVAVNRVGTETLGEKTSEFSGKSLVINPMGEVLVEAGDDEGVLSATITLDSVDKARRQTMFLHNLRQELYYKNSF